MANLNQEQLTDYIRLFDHPELQPNATDQWYISALSEHDAGLNITLHSPFPCKALTHDITQYISQYVQKDVYLTIEANVSAVRQHAISNVKNIVAIASGKGGVGKSTTAVNVAQGLIAQGARVGILDADIYGPSIPHLLGIEDTQIQTTQQGKFVPVKVGQLHAMSIGLLVDKNDATVWRGPMASRAFMQLLNDTQWPALDYLIIDMPPGTGDIQLTLAQQVPVAAAVIVTTPQNLALADAIKGIAMFDKVSVPVLGVIENMSYHLCEACGHTSHIFGEGAANVLADDYQTPILGHLPLDASIQQLNAQGTLLNAENSSGDIAQLYRRIAIKIASQLYLDLDMASSHTPDLTIRNK
ncbi:iron-sulfur cluster carrier protein ApbC [Thalassotalea agarivorans]|uniref:Iron-sulfur cluster carrier protein n=1 Tax=Thalassotalea agarivorans TaxID=349064 RepID=A0A1I0DK74_THASX|nr:iron-sulfur cluster carrier protein ApbC [Thalassotalea agarivorans]SET32879.1 ATP-binding protein involved in chromosome partitioning [Thalassotalea agarivorans]